MVVAYSVIRDLRHELLCSYHCFRVQRYDKKLKDESRRMKNYGMGVKEVKEVREVKGR